MKLILKRIDLYGQAVIPLCYLFASGGNIIYTFLLVIACHIVSCVINELLLNNDYKSAVRRTYEIILVIFGALFFFTYPRDLVIFENRGLGGSWPPPEEASIEKCALDAIVVLNDLKIKSFYVGGHSLGGMIALEIGKQCSSRVLGVISIEGVCHSDLSI